MKVKYEKGTEFDIHGSIHLGNKGFIEIPTRCILFIYLSALHVSGHAHLQELQMYLQTIGVCTSFDVLLHWIRYWLGHPSTFVTV